MPDREAGAASRETFGSCTARAFQGWGTTTLLNTGDDYGIVECPAIHGGGLPTGGGAAMYPEDSGPNLIPPGIYMVLGHVFFLLLSGSSTSVSSVEITWHPGTSHEGHDLSGGSGNTGYVYGELTNIPVGYRRHNCSFAGTIEVTESWAPRLEIGIHGGGRGSLADVFLHVFGTDCFPNHILTDTPPGG